MGSTLVLLVHRNMVARHVLVGVVHGPLEHGAINYASGAFMAAPEDGHALALLESVIVALKGTVASGHTA